MKHLSTIIFIILTTLCQAQEQDTIVKELPKYIEPISDITPADGFYALWDTSGGYSTRNDDPIGWVLDVGLGAGVRQYGFSANIFIGGISNKVTQPLWVYYPNYDNAPQGRKMAESEGKETYMAMLELGYSVYTLGRYTFDVQTGLGYGERQYRSRDGLASNGKRLSRSKGSFIFRPTLSVTRWWRDGSFLRLKAIYSLADYRLGDESTPIKGDYIGIGIAFGNVFWKF